MGGGKRGPLRNGKDRGHPLLTQAGAQEMPGPHQGGQADGTLCIGGNALAGYLAGLRAQAGREPTPPHRQDPTGRGQTKKNRLPARGPPLFNAQPADDHRTGDYALRGGANLELKEGGGQGVPGRHQPYGQVHTRSLRPTPLGKVTAESRLTPARALLDHRQAGFTRRQFARPQGEEGPEEIVERRDSALTTRLWAMVALRRYETVGPQQWSTPRHCAGRGLMEGRAHSENVPFLHFLLSVGDALFVHLSFPLPFWSFLSLFLC